MKNKRAFFFSFGTGLLFSGLIYFSFLFYLIPLCNVEGWLKDVLLEKKEIAKKTPSPKIIIISGSNAYWGMRSSVIQEKCGLPTVNCAFHGAFSLAFYKSILIDALNSGDTVVMPLEIDHYSRECVWNSTTLPAFLGWGKTVFSDFQHPFYELVLFYGFSACSDGKLFHKIIDSIFKGKKERTKQTQEKNDSTIISFDVYSIKNMNKYGDIIKTDDKDYYPPKGKLIPNNIKQFPSSLFLKEFFDLQQLIQSRGARLIITWPALCTTDSIEELQTIQQLCADAGITIYGDFIDFMFPPDAFSDAFYHLKDSFAEQRSEKMANLLNTILKD